MNSDQAQQLSSAIRSALSEILPDLLNILQHYQITEGLELRLVNMDQLLTDISQMPSVTCPSENSILCTYWDRTCPCWRPRICNQSTIGSDDPLGLGLDPEKTQQFCEDVASKLNLIMPPLGQSIPPSDESYEVHFLLDPDTVISQQPVVCEWSSDTSQENILQCSNP
ncbi:hypothetical protein H6F89_27330 [Cyanobacteria bacterium FACHB-63]|nr:hypothetical protein [Cyanobacteria bacterium FACHB-63]